MKPSRVPSGTAPGCDRDSIVLAVVLALAFGALCGEEAPPAALAPVTRDEVRQTVAAELRQRGVPEAQLPPSDDIDLAGAMAAPPHHTLRVASIGWDARQGRAEFRIACRAPSPCLPFLVYVRMERNLLPESGHSGFRSGAAKPARPAPAIRNGERATVVFVGDRLHLAAQVICLEHGAPGDLIRVRSADGHVFRARVSGPARLEAVSQPVEPVDKEKP